MNRDVLETTIYNIDQEALAILLKDHSTGKNIRWATNDYSNLGSTGYNEWDQILPDSIIREKEFVIQPRVDKSLVEQRSRTTDKAEVFTPSWVCNKQNNLIDAAWFGRGNAGFNKESDSENSQWITNPQPIRFSQKKTWQKYVKSPRLEVTCGEAPYLTSRYDTVIGEYIQPANRIGFLDRKLRVVTENTHDESEWMSWAIVALQSIYGYEYQGDNVLLARENLLYAVKEYFEYRWNKNMPTEFFRKCTDIISWNIWQMDGIKFVVPGTCHTVVEQEDLFGERGEEKPCPGCCQGNFRLHNGIRCRIMDWRINSPVYFMPPFDFQPIVQGTTV